MTLAGHLRTARAAAVLALLGGVLLLRRQDAGRIGCIAGSAAAVLATLTAAALAARWCTPEIHPT
ncbi:hypothetical protein SAMN05421837_103685 [Amycolatopsis pretoriensis]|uniref:Uncharacterized protein n=1 Tax=Amycolatopsis pretoriensis TaxID=218821 RepID=A0A1H5QMZ4_9PSEU|nr:hypothetical protein [Amycolatopsis pretoriensis]SEF27214.1 hypothetical protein SAMN05421837_103685 [Amycolatopsis pretoriensis]